MLSMRVVFLLVVAAVAWNVAAAQDYCAECQDNTLCRFPDDTPAEKCGNVIARGVDASDQQFIVDKHNELRARVASGQETLGSNGGQPGATNMQNLKWDDELATLAQHWVNQCDFGHDQCRNIPKTSVGQNLAMTMSSNLVNDGKSDWDKGVQMWYDEVKDFNKDDISPYKFSEATGHYTQLVWAESNLVGCGYIYYQDANDATYPYKAYYGCNYGPTGNMIDGKMYETA